jgi:CubicO group peptidase (beta-lactamase class C family)
MEMHQTVAGIALTGAVVALLTNAPGLAASQTAALPRADAVRGPHVGTGTSGLADQLAALADEMEIPAGAVVVVRQGEVVLLETFGVRDQLAGEVTQETVFRVASVSKVFTAATAATVVAEGRLSLDADLREGRSWLRDRAPGQQPVTLRQLLTHTAGFDDHAVGMFASKHTDVLPLGEYLRRRMPRRTTEPGRWTRYSNHGAALAGLVIEETTDLPFADLVRDRLLAPLAMTSSSFAQPIPPQLLDRLARAFPCRDAACEPLPIDYRHTPPAGALVTTPADMARFMIAVLDPNDARVGRDAVALLTARSWGHRPELPGIALALQEQPIASRRGLVHAGSSSGYKSLLALVPEARAGLFVVTTGGSSGFGGGALELFEDLLGPGPATPALDFEPGPLGAGDHEAYTGEYLLARAARATYESFPGRFLYQHRLGVDDDGFLTRREGGELRRYGRVEGDLFADVDGPGVMAFERGPKGEIVALHAAQAFNGARYPATYERPARWAAPGFMNELLSWVAGLPVLALLVWVVGGGASRILRRWRRAGRAADVLPRTRLAWIGLALVLPSVAGILAFGFGFMGRFNALAMTAPEALAAGMPQELARLLWLPWAVAGCSVVLAAVAVASWRKPSLVRLGDRLLLSIVSLCAVVFTLLLHYFNMLPPAG